MAESPDNGSRQLPAALPARLDSLTPAQQAVHNNFLDAVDGLKRNLVRTIFYLRAVLDRRILLRLGFTRITDYAQHYAALTPRQTQEFLVLSNRLGELPDIAAALGRGDLTWSQAREITRAATPENQKELIDLARSVSRQELRVRIRAGVLDPASPPIPAEPPPEFRAPLVGRDERRAESPNRPPLRPPVRSAPVERTLTTAIADEQHLRLRLTAEQYARWESLLEERRKQQPGLTAVEVVLDALAAAPAAAGTPESSRAPYLIVLMTCPACGDTRIPTSRGEATASAALLAAANCDASVEQPDGNRRQVVLPRLRRLALQRARYACEAAGCRHTRFLEIHHRVPVAVGGRTEMDNLIVLCSRCHRSLHRDEADLRQQRGNIEHLAASDAVRSTPEIEDRSV